MNKAELITSISEKSDLTKKDSEKALNSFFETIEETLSKGEKIQLIGFGSFEVRERAARQGRNPQTKAEITIPASKVPVFRVGKALKDYINKE